MTTAAKRAAHAEYMRGWSRRRRLQVLEAGAAQRLRGWPLGTRVFARSVIQEDGCWIYTGHRHGGYGWTKQGPAHRATYTQFVGPIPEGMELDHLCRNRACVNPSHLEPVTTQENTRRRDVARVLAGSTGTNTRRT